MNKINKLKVHFMSTRLDWNTPEWLYNKLDEEFDFDCDPSPPESELSKFDGLKDEWGNRNYCNPPYGNEIPKWIKKGYEEYKKGKLVVFLIPSRTDTRWWHDYIMKATEIRFIKGRLKFVGVKHPAPFPNMLVIFK